MIPATLVSRRPLPLLRCIAPWLGSERGTLQAPQRVYSARARLLASHANRVVLSKTRLLSGKTAEQLGMLASSLRGHTWGTLMIKSTGSQQIGTAHGSPNRTPSGAQSATSQGAAPQQTWRCRSARWCPGCSAAPPASCPPLCPCESSRMAQVQGPHDDQQGPGAAKQVIWVP